ncbi:MAG: GHKL domain-containing protein [Eubacteriaceae bacterium]
MNEEQKKILKFAIIIFVVAGATIAFFRLLYEYDNKYTHYYPSTQTGEVDLRTFDFQDETIFLVDGWELYRNVLLTPENFEANQLPEKEAIFIGQYGGFENLQVDQSSPQGSATYRITLLLPPVEKEYMLECPIIFSSYDIFINGESYQGKGNPDPVDYQPEIQNGLIAFKAKDRVEIIIGATDYSHLYSGLIYPPCFGSPQKVSQLLNTRFIFQLLFCLIAIFIGLLSIPLGRKLKENQKIYAIDFLLLGLFFAIYTGFPIWQTLFPGDVQPGFSIQSLGYFGFMLILIHLYSKICEQKKGISYFFLSIGFLMCVISVGVPLFLINDQLNLMLMYGKLVDGYKWVVAGYFLVSSGMAVYKNKVYSKPLFIGVEIFGISLIMDRWYPLFEPARFLWFTEFGNFILMLFIGNILWGSLFKVLKENFLMEKEIEFSKISLNIQRKQYELQMNRIEETKRLQHDLRQHIALIEFYNRQEEYQELTTYIQKYKQVILGNTFEILTENKAINAMVLYYKQQGEVSGIKMITNFRVPNQLGIEETDLCIVFGNLLENAVEACQKITKKPKEVEVNAKLTSHGLVIIVKNPYEGEIIRGKDTLLSTKRVSEKGIGLNSIESVAKKYNGSATFQVEEKEKQFRASIFLEPKD